MGVRKKSEATAGTSSSSILIPNLLQLPKHHGCVDEMLKEHYISSLKRKKLGCADSSLTVTVIYLGTSHCSENL